MSADASPTDFVVKLKGRQEIADRTMAFHFEKPRGFVFKAGQYIDVTLIDPPESDDEGITRSFSIASAPSEEGLTVATRMRDTAFKRTLGKMPPGSPIKIEGPFGSLVLHNNASKPAVLVAGGIGITPFRSILLRASGERLAHRIFLFYSNRRPEDAPFLGELDALQHVNPNYRLIATMTQIEKSKLQWKGETGTLDREFFDSHLAGINSAIYYIAGPPPMVAGVREVLNSTGIDDDDIRAEDFAGY